MTGQTFPVPEGWFVFGTHLENPGPLEFSQESDDSGLPLWERPRTKPAAHCECDCVPAIGPPHCHGCGEDEGHPVRWDDRLCPNDNQEKIQ